MLKTGKKFLALLLAVTMLVSVSGISAGAAMLAEGTNGKTIYLSTELTDTKGNPVESAKSGSYVYVKVFFAGNSTQVEESVRNYNFMMEFDGDKLSYSGVDKKNSLTVPTANSPEKGIVLAGWADPDGIYVEVGEEPETTNEIQASGLLLTVYLKATADLTSDDLASIRILKEYDSDVLKMGAYSVMLTPALTVTADRNFVCYDTTTADEVKAALTVELIDTTGKATAVNDFEISCAQPDENDNVVVTVTAGGLSESISFKAVTDTVESISVTGSNKLTYTSGDKLDLTGLTVTATCKSGKTRTVTDFTAAPAAGTTLTVAGHNGKSVTISAEGKTAQTGALTVKPVSVTVPTADGSYAYNGKIQNFTIGNDVDREKYTISGSTSGTDVGTYTATVALKDKTETCWSDGTTADKTLTWAIAANKSALTVTVAGTFTYNGSEQTPDVTVKSGETTLTKDRDYTVSYRDNQNAGTACVTVTGVNNYAGASGSATFEIAPVELTADDFVFEGSTTKTYDGTTAAPAGLTVKVREGALKGSDARFVINGSFAYNSANVADATAITFTADGIAAGNYRLAAGTKAEIAGSILAKDVSEKRAQTGQNIVRGVGSFTEPAFDSVTGTLTYTYADSSYTGFEALVTELAKLGTGTSVVVDWTFAASGNYTGNITGSIQLTVVDIVFTVNGDAASVENAVTVKGAPVYGDNWSDIVKKSATIIASVNGAEDADQSHFSFVESGRPAAGEQSYTLVYNGTINGAQYTNAVVLTGTVNVARKNVTLTNVTVADKTYDGQLQAELNTSNCYLEGVIREDSGKVGAAFTGVSASFETANAGENKAVTISGTVSLTGEAAVNYVLTNAALTGLTGKILPREITIGSVSVQGRDYEAGRTDVTVTGVKFENTVETLEKDVDYTAAGAMANADAGENKAVTVSVNLLNGNYTLKNSRVETTVAIGQIAYTGVQTAESSAKYGNANSIDLASLLPACYTLTLKGVEDGKGIFDGNPALDGAVVSYKLKNDKALVGETAAVTLTVSSTNYAPFDLTVTVEVLDKLSQTLTSDSVSTVYGNTFALSVTGGQTALTYAVKEGSGDKLTFENGKFTAKGVGTAYITVTAAESDTYAAASLDVMVEIGKRTLTATADSFTLQTGSKTPALTCTASGFVFGDGWVEEPALAFAGEVDMSKPGEYAILLTGGDAGENYNILRVNGKLTVVSQSVVVPPVSGGSAAVLPTDNGSISVSTPNAPVGSTVTVVATPDSGYALSGITVTDRFGNALSLTELGNGLYSFVMPAGGVIVGASFAKVIVSYPDVSRNDWYYAAVQYVTEKGIMTGTDRGFEPDLGTSRAMIWTVLARLDGVDTTASGKWYSVAQAWAVNSGISDGTEPEALITREQFVTMLYRYAQSRGLDVSVGADTNILSFADAGTISDYAIPAMEWACGLGIVNGMDDKLAPHSSATRAQAATMLMRFLELVE